MANVSVTVNGRSYELTCNDGQEPHLKELAADIDRRLQDLVKTVGQAGESRLLLMVSLLIADELADAGGEIERLQHGQAQVVEDGTVVASIEQLARRIQDIAARLDAT